MQTEALVHQFLGECEMRGLSVSTINQDRWALNRLEKQCPELPCSEVDLLSILGDRSLALESRKDLLKCMKTFFGWANRRYELPNPCSELAPLSRRRQLPRVLTHEEVDRLMLAAVSCRDRALLLTVLDCGLRVGEVAGLSRGSILDDWLVVVGKSGVRQVPVSRSLSRLLKDLGQGEHIWVGKKGPLSRVGVMQAYKRMFARAGITGRKTGPHALRHTFATQYLRTGGGVRQLQAILGHSRIETTMIYVHLAGVDVLADHFQHSPARTLGLLDAGENTKQR